MLALTTTTQEGGKTMVAANQVYHSKVAHVIPAMAMYEAEQAVKRRLQAEGKKISWYLPNGINVMAHSCNEVRSARAINA
jgi:hypothetical protein